MNGKNTNHHIEKIVQKIVNEFDPEKIILFGSWAWGEPTPDSDVDLLIVKESEKSRLEQQGALDNLLYPRQLPLDILVYTPAGLDEKIHQDRNLFLEDVVTNGVVLYERNQVRR